MKQETRAMAFHHESGFAAQLELARAFAGETGRIATMEDIVHARLSQNNPRHYVWWNTFITDTHLYTGRSQGGSDLLVIKHGTGPETVPAWKLHGLREDESRHYKHPMIDKGTFAKLESGHFGDVAIIELEKYVNKSSGNSADNRYRTEQALEDPIILAALGREAEAYLTFQHERMQVWLAANPQKDREGFIAMITRLYNIYGNEYGERDHYSLSVGYGRVYNLTLARTHFYNGRDSEPRSASGCEIDVAVNSGIDDLIFTPYYVVGIRGKESITTIQPSLLNIVSDVKENWPTFVQPSAEVSNDPFAGIRPDGSAERPYYLLSKWGSKPQCTGRIKVDGTEATVPEYRIKKLRRIKAPPTFTFTRSTNTFDDGYPYPGMWEAALSAMPEDANAISFGGSSHRGNTIEVSVAYWHAELDDEPFSILMKCGEDFFTQYADEKKLTAQPHRHVKEYTLIDSRTRLRIPDEVYHRQESSRESWPVLTHLIAAAPAEANAMWVEKQSVGHVEKLHKNVCHVTVHYYRVAYDELSFRPLAEIRADFDWQLKKREEAGLLTV